MKYRFMSGWTHHEPISVALCALTDYTVTIPRVGNLFPGVSSPIPSGPYGGDLESIVMARAAELWQRYDTILVLWSGGTDSTMAAAALAKLRGDRRLIVSLSGREEKQTGPEVYQWFVDQGCEFLDATPASMRQIAEEGGMVVTGHHADSLLLGEYADLGEAIWDMTLLEAVMAKTGMTEAWAQRQIDEVQVFFDYLELEHTTVNMCWWLDFAACWDQDEMSYYLMYHLAPPGEGYVTFYGSEDFQRWAMQPVEDKVGRGDKAFKYRFHEIVEKLLGFKPQIVHRNNEPMELGVVSRIGACLAIREDWSLVASHPV